VRYPTPHSPGTLIENIAKAIMEVGDGHEVGRTCLAVPGFILSQEDKVFSPNLHAIEGIPLKDELEPEIGMPLTIENDANAAA
jgi:glucokinase